MVLSRGRVTRHESSPPNRLPPPFTKSHRTGIQFLKSISPSWACVIKAAQRRESINLPNTSLQDFLNSSWTYIYKHFLDKNAQHFVHNVRASLDSQKRSVGPQRGLRTAARESHWQTGDSTPLFSGGNIVYLFFSLCFKVFFLRITFQGWVTWTTLISDNLGHLPFPVPYQLVGELESALPPSPHALAVGGSWRRRRACLITL